MPEKMKFVKWKAQPIPLISPSEIRIPYPFIQNCQYGDHGKEEYDFLNNPECEIIYEKHGWNNVKDFYEEFSSLEDGQEYALLFKLVPGKATGAIGSAFATTILGMLLQSNSNKHMLLSCNLRDNAEDDQNHFWLLKKKK